MQNSWVELASAIIVSAGIIAGALKLLAGALVKAIGTHTDAMKDNTVAIRENTSTRKALLPLLLLPLLLLGACATDPAVSRALDRNRQVWEEDRRPDLDAELVKSREAEFDAQRRYFRGDE